MANVMGLISPPCALRVKQISRIISRQKKATMSCHHQKDNPLLTPTLLRHNSGLSITVILFFILSLANMAKQGFLSIFIICEYDTFK